MKRYTMRVALAAAAALLGAAVPGGAHAQGADGTVYTPGPFDVVEISGSAQVRFVQGDADRIVVEGNDEARKSVSLDLRGRTLNIQPSGSWKFWNAQRVQVTVTARELTRVVISGAADWHAASPVRVNRLEVAISGAGLARFDQLKAEQLSFQVSGAGDGQVAGVAKDLSVSISGRSEFRGEDLMSQRARVTISGLGQVKVWAEQELGVTVAGFGSVDYWGTPAVRRSVSGRATINDHGAKKPAP